LTGAPAPTDPFNLPEVDFAPQGPIITGKQSRHQDDPRQDLARFELGLPISNAFRTFRLVSPVSNSLLPFRTPFHPFQTRFARFELDLPTSNEQTNERSTSV